MSLLDLRNGDCLEVLKDLEPNLVDSIVTDPPYGISFMARKWDYDVPSVDIWHECLRVLKPGGHLLAFAGTRTQHRMCVNIEDAGFEIRDMIAWLYGSGFPKSHNLKGEWEGWGTALKPALEPITVARKPIKGTVAQNVSEHGTGGINIDACRVELGDERNPSIARRKSTPPVNNVWADQRSPESYAADRPSEALGRWPANLIHDGSDEVVGLFPQSNSSQPSANARYGDGKGRGGNATYGDGLNSSTPNRAPIGDSGSAARFFQQCKGGYDEVWQDLNLPRSLASTAESNSSQQRQAAVSALVLAVNSALPEGLHCSDLLMAPSTTATGNELRLIAESVTQAILNTAPRFWQELEPARLSLSSNPVNVVVQREPTGITTITASHWKSDGSAEPVTYNITLNNLEAGERDSVARFKYCAKANKKDREEGLETLPDSAPVFGASKGDGLGRGISNTRQDIPRKNTHPTVKPTDLMAYLCRLVTPPGGIILDPFMGSGSTGKAAMREGFSFIGIEREAEYYAIAQQRVSLKEDVQLGLIA